MSRKRILFEKRGYSCFVRHVELPQLFGRIARRAGFSLELTEGFSPHAKIVMGPALPVGVPSLGELAELWPLEAVTEREFLDRFNAAAPTGFRFLACRDADGRVLNKVIDAASYWVCPRNRPVWEAVEPAARDCYGDGLLNLSRDETGLELTLSSPSALGIGMLVRALTERQEIAGWPEICIARLALGTWNGEAVVPLLTPEGGERA